MLEKNKAHLLGKWHVTAHIWIYNSKGEILFQKRSLTKSTFPGLWDISVAGHVSKGETVEEGACREVLEEIGLKVGVEDLEKVFVFKESNYHKDKSWYNNEFHHVFLHLLDGGISQFTLQEEEVDEVRFLSVADLRLELLDKEKKKGFVSDLEYYSSIMSLVVDRI